jgi:hypothetical protein
MPSTLIFTVTLLTPSWLILELCRSHISYNTLPPEQGELSRHSGSLQADVRNLNPVRDEGFVFFKASLQNPGQTQPPNQYIPEFVPGRKTAGG